jgi:hypothetical protein
MIAIDGILHPPGERGTANTTTNNSKKLAQSTNGCQKTSLGRSLLGKDSGKQSCKLLNLPH